MEECRADPKPSQDVGLNAFHGFRNQVYACPEGGEKLARVYDGWAETYTEDTLSVGYLGPANLADIAAEIISDKSSRILDAASGTGMLGEELKVRGFTCIDALDPSHGSLEKSKEHQTYTEYICDTLDEHQTQIADNHYDAVLMCGAFGVPGHVTLSCFPELIRITKPGGYIMFTMSTKVAEQWNDRLEVVIQAEHQRGTIALVEYRWILYLAHSTLNEKAKVPILRVLEKEDVHVGVPQE